MIIETRYRDIPFDEARKCAKPGSALTENGWEKRRKQPIMIETPGHQADGYFACEGPVFWVYPPQRDKQLHRRAVCPHIAEIGD